MTKQKQIDFHGFKRVSYTQVPDQFFDQLMPDLDKAELRALLYIIRRTFGFKKDRDAISLSQMMDGIVTENERGEEAILDRGTNLAKRHLLRALESLEQAGIIHRERRCEKKRGSQATLYSLVFEEEAGKSVQGTEARKAGRNNETRASKKKSDKLGYPKSPGGGYKREPGGGHQREPGTWSPKVTTQQTEEQQTVEQQQGLLLLKNFAIPDSLKSMLLQTYGLEKIKDVVAEIQGQRKPPENKEGWLIQALRDGWRLAVAEEREKRMAREGRLRGNLEQALAEDRLEKAKQRVVDEWVALHPDRFRCILDEEFHSLPGRLRGDATMAKVKARLRVERDILKIIE